MTILLGVGVLTFHRYMHRTLICIAFVRLLLGAFVHRYRGDHLWLRSQVRCLHLSAMQTMTRRFDFGFAGAVTSCPFLSGYLGILGDIETNNGARDVAKQRRACRGSLAHRYQCCKSQDCASHHHDSPREARNSTGPYLAPNVARTSSDCGLARRQIPSERLQVIYGTAAIMLIQANDSLCKFIQTKTKL